MLFCAEKNIIFYFKNLFQELCEHGEKTELQEFKDLKEIFQFGHRVAPKSQQRSLVEFPLCVFLPFFALLLSFYHPKSDIF